MKILAFGVHADGTPLFQPADETAVAESLLAALQQEMAGVRTQGARVTRGGKKRGEVKRRVVDVGDPHEVGWSFLVAANDPQRTDVERILRPLALHRGMPQTTPPLVFSAEREGEWGDWLQDAYYGLALEGKPVPRYVLMVGEPAHLPFRLQALLGTVASVGRVSFERLDDLERYVQKLIRLETGPEPVVERQVLLFGPDEDITTDPTYYSRRHMIEPLAARVRDDLHFDVTSLVGADATKPGLESMLRGARPALVYTASHGLAPTLTDDSARRRYTGAIQCSTDGGSTLKALFSAEDVPDDEAFLEGSVFFQFACFGYGTPAESDYNHWVRGVPKQFAEADYLAALPRRLLAHPRGPIAYIGHLDMAFLHGFADPNEPPTADRWTARIQPYLQAVDRLLGVQPSGLALEGMSKRLNVANQLLMIYYDRQRRGTLDVTADSNRRLVDHWIFRSDAQNYMVFGDPAARLRIPEAET